jgi:hypothetical protein
MAKAYITNIKFLVAENKKIHVSSGDPPKNLNLLIAKIITTDRSINPRKGEAG